MINFKKLNLQPNNQGLFLILILITVISRIVPLQPSIPGESLDPSWALGTNQAITQGFTFGPYASIYTQAYHPATDALIIWSSLYLAVFFTIAIHLNFKETRWYVKILLLIILAGIVHSRDALLFYYPLLVGTYLFKFVTSKPELSTTTIRSNLLLIALFTPFGLLPLIKGSLLLSCSAIIILSVLLLLFNKRWIAALNLIL
ncbi:MAG: hypothetical protein QNK11_09385 [Legionella sp.]|nr:hypothetical protein [Legionella sp.]